MTFRFRLRRQPRATRLRLVLATALLVLAVPAMPAAGNEPDIPPPRPADLERDQEPATPPTPPRPTPPREEGAGGEPAGPGRASDSAAASRPRFDLGEALGCESALRDLGARFELREPLEEVGGCGAERPLELQSLPGSVELLGPPVLLRCEIALALAAWVEEVVLPSAELHLGTPAKGLAVSTTYQCRDRIGGGTPSQHAFANAVDVMGLSFTDGSSMLVQERPDSAEPVRAFQAAIRGGACAYFPTVLGPATDADHADHLHLDLQERRGGYRICQ